MIRPEKRSGGWRIRWYDAAGRRRSKTFPTHTAAQRAALFYQTEAQEVRLGLKPEHVEDRAFSELCDYWLQHRTPRKKNPRDDNSIINTHLRPFFGSLPLRQLTLERVDAYRRTKCPREYLGPDMQRPRRGSGIVTPKTLHNHLTLLISMLNMAVDLGWLLKKPRIRKPRLLPEGFCYIRTKDDIQKFLAAALDEDPGVFELYATAIYTGMRAGELLGLRWSDVDLDRRLITVQRSYRDTTKSNRIRHVPVVDSLLPILRAWKLSCPSSNVVFPSEKGTPHGPSARILQEILKKVRERAGIEYKFTFHSLRHTFASHWTMAGGDLYRLQRILGHQSIVMTERYSHLAPDAFASDHAIFGSALPIVANRDSEANVVALLPLLPASDSKGD